MSALARPGLYHVRAVHEGEKTDGCRAALSVCCLPRPGPRPTGTTMRFFSAVLVCGYRFVRAASNPVQETSNDEPLLGYVYTKLREDEVRQHARRHGFC